MNQLLKLLLICQVLLLAGNMCFAQFSDGKAPAWAPLNGKVDSVIITEYAVTKSDMGQTKQRKYKIGLVYDKNGKLALQDMYSMAPKKQPNSPDRIQMRMSNNYDEGGRLIGTIFNNGYSNVVKEIYTYKSGTLQAEAKKYGISDNVLLETAQIQLDEAGDMVERSVFDTTAKLVSKFTSKYNDRGQRIEETEFGVFIKPDTRKWLNTYNANGDLIRQVYYVGPGTTVANNTSTYTYLKFDDQHNWLVKNIFVNGKLIRVTERSITYYK